MGKKTVAVVFARSPANTKSPCARRRRCCATFRATATTWSWSASPRTGAGMNTAGSVDDLEADRWLENGPVTPAVISPDRSCGGPVAPGPRRAGKRPRRRDLPRHARRARRGRHHPGAFRDGGHPLCGLRGAGLLHLHGQGRHPHPARGHGHPHRALRGARASSARPLRFPRALPAGEARLPDVRQARPTPARRSASARRRTGRSCSPP